MLNLVSLHSSKCLKAAQLLSFAVFVICCYLFANAIIKSGVESHLRPDDLLIASYSFDSWYINNESDCMFFTSSFEDVFLVFDWSWRTVRKPKNPVIFRIKILGSVWEMNQWQAAFEMTSLLIYSCIIVYSTHCDQVLDIDNKVSFKKINERSKKTNIFRSFTRAIHSQSWRN